MKLMLGFFIASAIFFIAGVGLVAWRRLDKFFKDWGH